MRLHWLMAVVALVVLFGCDREAKSQAQERGHLVKNNIAITEPDILGEPIDWGEYNTPNRAFLGTKINDDGKIQHECNLQYIGMNRFEDGKACEHSFERWDIQIQNPPYSPDMKGTYCHIVRERFSTGFLDDGNVYVNVDEYMNVGDTKSIVIDREDWNAGAIDLRIDWGMGKGSWFYANGEQPLFVQIRFTPDKTNNFMFSHLSSITATSTVKEYSGEQKLVQVKYNAAEYDYMLNAPLKFSGLKSGGQKRWNMMIDTLDDKDKAIWEDMKKRKDEMNVTNEELRKVTEAIKNKIPDIDKINKGERKATKEENEYTSKMYSDNYVNHFKAFLDNSRLSNSAKKKMIECFSDQIYSK